MERNERPPDDAARGDVQPLDDRRPALEPDWMRMHRPGGWLRFESGWLSTDQTLKNLETAVSLLQKALDGLNGINQLMDDAMASVNEFANRVEAGEDPPPDSEIAQTVRTRLNQIDEIVRQCRFHGRGLLDGQSGVQGVGVGCEFIRGGPNTRSSPREGYKVDISVVPSRSTLKGGVRLDDDWVRAEQEIFLAEGENFFRYLIAPDETAESLLTGLRRKAREAGLDVQIGLSAQGQLAIRHIQYGSQYKFKGCSFKTPLLSHRPGKVEWSRKGQDIQGTLGGEPAFGIGRMLVGYLDNPATSELAVMWQGGRDGRCHVRQNALCFQEGAKDDSAPVRIALPSFDTRQLGRWMETASGYRSLQETRFGTAQERRDALHLMMAVSFEVEEWREKVESWVKRYQNRALACLRKGGSGIPEPTLDAQVTAEQAERMARQLRELIHAGWQEQGGLRAHLTPRRQ